MGSNVIPSWDASTVPGSVLEGSVMEAFGSSSIATASVLLGSIARVSSRYKSDVIIQRLSDSMFFEQQTYMIQQFVVSKTILKNDRDEENKKTNEKNNAYLEGEKDVATNPDR